jgi:cell wall-associated NlpC family hydrolase
MIAAPASPAPFMPTPLPACLPLTPEKEAALRDAVIAEAMKWNGARYVQQGDHRYDAIDCAMLLVRCWVDAGVFQPFDPRPYPPNWHLNRQATERYLEWMQSLAHEVAAPRPGDVVLWRMGWCFSHGGIIVNRHDHVMHALAEHRKCTMTDLDEAFLRWDRGKSRPRRFFDVFAPLRGLTVPPQPAPASTRPA